MRPSPLLPRHLSTDSLRSPLGSTFWQNVCILICTDFYLFKLLGCKLNTELTCFSQSSVSSHFHVQRLPRELWLVSGTEPPDRVNKTPTPGPASELSNLLDCRAAVSCQLRLQQALRTSPYGRNQGPAGTAVKLAPADVTQSLPANSASKRNTK